MIDEYLVVMFDRSEHLQILKRNCIKMIRHSDVPKNSK